jgi:hypothetical protein
MAEVVVLPGVEAPHLGAMVTTPVEAVVAGLVENGVTEMVVVGRARDGSLYLAATHGDADRAAGMLMRAVHVLSSEDWTPSDFSTDDEA